MLVMVLEMVVGGWIPTSWELEKLPLNGIEAWVSIQISSNLYICWFYLTNYFNYLSQGQIKTFRGPGHLTCFGRLNGTANMPKTRAPT